MKKQTKAGQDSEFYKISIVIVNWNGNKDTIECLESIERINYPNLEVVVVDNGSTDRSVECIRNQYPKIVLIETGKNLGKAGGSNCGIKYAVQNGAEYVLLLDNDAIVDSLLINNLIKAYNCVEKHSILAAKIYYYNEPDKIWFAGAEWKKNHFIHIGLGSTDKENMFNSIVETAYACGCALFVDKTVINKIGKLDERFFCYFEETDFCYRARAAGFKIYFIPSAIVWHKVSSSSGGEESPLFNYFMNRNILLWAEKNLAFEMKIKIFLQIAKQMILNLCSTKLYLTKTFKDFFPQRYRKVPQIIFINYIINNFKSTRNLASLYGIKDYILRRFGNCPEYIRLLKR